MDLVKSINSLNSEIKRINENFIKNIFQNYNFIVTNEKKEDFKLKTFVIFKRVISEKFKDGLENFISKFDLDFCSLHITEENKSLNIILELNNNNIYKFIDFIFSEVKLSYEKENQIKTMIINEHIKNLSEIKNISGTSIGQCRSDLKSIKKGIDINKVKNDKLLHQHLFKSALTQLNNIQDILGKRGILTLI